MQTMVAYTSALGAKLLLFDSLLARKWSIFFGGVLAKM